VAQIATELEVAPDIVLYREGDLPEALYVVIAGEVDLQQGGAEIGVARAGEAFGTWALVDDAPRLATATARTAATLLRVRRDEFVDLLSDRPAIAQALLKAMVDRIRSVAELAKG
jgi:CRP-like cAMP-binding protein